LERENEGKKDIKSGNEIEKWEDKER